MSSSRSRSILRHLNRHALRGTLLLSCCTLLLIGSVGFLMLRGILHHGGNPMPLAVVEPPLKTTPLFQPTSTGSTTHLLRNTPSAQTSSEALHLVSRESTTATTFEPEITSTDKPLPQPMRYFNGRPIRPVRQMRMKVTAYSPDSRSCGRWADGTTASGYSVWTNGSKLVAADTRLLPFGSIISIPGYHHGQPVPVLDRGGRIKGHRLDVLYPTHQIARRWGVRQLTVTVWEYADTQP